MIPIFLRFIVCQFFNLFSPTNDQYEFPPHCYLQEAEVASQVVKLDTTKGLIHVFFSQRGTAKVCESLCSHIIWTYVPLNLWLFLFLYKDLTSCMKAFPLIYCMDRFLELLIVGWCQGRLRR